MGKRPKRKIVLFLVEGKSDRTALSLAVPELFDRIDDSFEVFFPSIREHNVEVGGDITSKRGVEPENIQGLISQLFLEDFFDEEKIYPKDIYEIIQLVDMDGAYADDSFIEEGSNPTGEERAFYERRRILCTNTSSMKEAHNRKRRNLDALTSMHSIKIDSKSVPYSIYYFSCNLDHFLHGDANLKSREKVHAAEEFSEKYAFDPIAFYRFISSDPCSASGKSYSESWDYIKDEAHSLERGTNLNLLLNRLLSEAGD